MILAPSSTFTCNQTMTVTVFKKWSNKGLREVQQNLLSVSAVSNGLVLVISNRYVPQETVRYVFDDTPLHREATNPFILLPILHRLVEINRTCHLRNTNELPTCIHLQRLKKKQSNRESTRNTLA